MSGGTTLLLLFISTIASGNNCPKCRQTQTHGMSSSDCYDLKLTEVPQCLRSDIEILELSFNRIRRITKNDLDRYRNLKILYLSDNMIMNIDEEALIDKTSLEILDISYNAFMKVPTVIFHLPSLQKLHMSRNQNINIAQDIEESKPITSPLTYLNIAFNDLRELPNLGIIPTLLYYNISGNVNVKMNTSKFAGICKLKVLYNNNTTGWFDDPCECWSLQIWLEKRKVEFNSLNCQTKVCDLEISLEDLKIFDECNETYNDMVVKANMIQIVLPLCVLGLVLIFLTSIIIIVRKKRQKRNLRQEKNEIITQILL